MQQASNVDFSCVHARAAGHVVLDESCAMVFECGPWAGCKLGLNCPYALTQQVSSLLSCLLGPTTDRRRYPLVFCMFVVESTVCMGLWQGQSMAGMQG